MCASYMDEWIIVVSFLFFYSVQLIWDRVSREFFVGFHVPWSTKVYEGEIEFANTQLGLNFPYENLILMKFRTGCRQLYFIHFRLPNYFQIINFKESHPTFVDNKRRQKKMCNVCKHSNFFVWPSLFGFRWQSMQKEEKRDCEERLVGGRKEKSEFQGGQKFEIGQGVFRWLFS